MLRSIRSYTRWALSTGPMRSNSSYSVDQQMLVKDPERMAHMKVTLGYLVVKIVDADLGAASAVNNVSCSAISQ